MIPLVIGQLNPVQQFTVFLAWVLALFGFVAILFSIGLLLQNYFRTNSLDYLIFAGIFFMTSLIVFTGISIVQIVPPITELSDKLILIVFSILWGVFTFLIFLHAFRLRYDWKKKPRVLWYFSLLWFFFYSIAAIFMSFVDVVSGMIYTLSIFVMFIVYFYVGLFLTYVYISVAPVKPTDRIEFVRKVYILFGIIMMLMSLNQFVFGSLFLITNDSNVFSIALLIHCLLAIIQGLPILYICAFFPELLLISHVQILRAVKLYQKVKKMPTENLEGDKLLVYLNSIPETFFE
ncbi:MAG: hypothetical protein JSV04_12235 [Candidatus Heimdallarchaeota archaeon]|nr:MAG: hypothetical protein JSV04_12235 [Candidatus Heimdallarchaeota archaeon]